MGVRRLHLFVIAAVVSGWAASAAAVTVAIVRPPAAPPVMAETVVRIAGELTSVGFAIEMVDAPSAAERAGGHERAWLEQVANQRGVDAVVALIGAAAPDAVEVWVIDRVTGKSVVRRVPFEPKAARAPETLSIRAIELLRSSFLEIDLGARASSEKKSPPPAAIVSFVGIARAPARPERFGLEVGAAGITSWDGVGPAVLPVVRLGWAAEPWLLVQATFAGLGTRPTVATSAGSAQVEQAYGLVGAAWRMRSGERVGPLLSLAGGALHTAVEGRADSPNHGASAAQDRKSVV